MTLAPVD